MKIKTSAKLESPKIFFAMHNKIGVKKASPHFGTLLTIYTTINFVPFEVLRRVKDYKEEYVLTKSAKCRTIVAGFVHASIFLGNIAWAGFNIVKYTRATQSSIASTFFLVSQMANIIAVLLFQNILWRKREDLERFINITGINSNESFWKPKLFTVVIYSVMCLSAFHNSFIASGSEVELNNFHSFLGNLFSPMANMLGVNPESVPPGSGRLSKHICWFMGSSIFFFALGTQNQIMPFLLSVSQTINSFVKAEFSVNIQASYGNLGQIIEHYEKIKELTILSESIFGGTILAFYITMLAFIAIAPQVLMESEEELMMRLMIIPYILMPWLIMTNAANANTMAENSLRDCIRHHQWKSKCDTDEKCQLLALSHDMDTEPVGLSCGFFTITRTVLSSIFGLVVTYGIIVFQMGKSEQAFWRS